MALNKILSIKSYLLAVNFDSLHSDFSLTVIRNCLTAVGF